MNRQEEIEKEAVFRYPEMTSNFIAFIKGAKYADETMLDRACEWLKLRISVDVSIETNENGEPLAGSWIYAQMERAKAAEELIAEFRQAMEGGTE